MLPTVSEMDFVAMLHFRCIQAGMLLLLCAVVWRCVQCLAITACQGQAMRDRWGGAGNLLSWSSIAVCSMYACRLGQQHTCPVSIYKHALILPCSGLLVVQEGMQYRARKITHEWLCQWLTCSITPSLCRAATVDAQAPPYSSNKRRNHKKHKQHQHIADIETRSE